MYPSFRSVPSALLCSALLPLSNMPLSRAAAQGEISQRVSPMGSTEVWAVLRHKPLGRAVPDRARMVLPRSILQQLAASCGNVTLLSLPADESHSALPRRSGTSSSPAFCASRRHRLPNTRRFLSKEHGAFGQGCPRLKTAIPPETYYPSFGYPVY